MKGFDELWATLDGGPEPLALVVGDGADVLVTAAAVWRGVSPVSVGSLLTVENPGSWKTPERPLRGYHALVDLDVLFWPRITADPLRLLRSLGRPGPLIVHWPGHIDDGRARYSEPGRRDFYDEPLAGEVVVRSRPISSPTDVLYDLEISR